jgi:hypothetical protein
MVPDSAATDYPSRLSTAIAKLHKGGLRGFARHLADRLANVLGFLAPPIDPFLVAKQLDVETREVWINAQAQLVFEGDRPVILVKRERFPLRAGKRGRRHFVLAHELGHFTLREKIRDVWPMFYFSSDCADEERFCDFFAAELLMPFRWFLTDLGRLGLLPSALVTLAETYGVSRQAAVMRAAELSDGIEGVIWIQESGVWRVKWASSTRLRGAVLCDSPRASVVRSHATGEECAGIIEFLVDGKRLRSSSVALRPSRSADVLSLLAPVGSSRPEWADLRKAGLSRSQSVILFRSDHRSKPETAAVRPRLARTQTYSQLSLFSGATFER